MEEPGNMPVMEPEKTFEPRGDDEALVWVIERRQNENVSALQSVCEVYAKTLSRRSVCHLHSTSFLHGHILTNVNFPCLFFVMCSGFIDMTPKGNIILARNFPCAEERLYREIQMQVVRIRV
jgi:hypothetical protein